MLKSAISAGSHFGITYVHDDVSGQTVYHPFPESLQDGPVSE